MKIDYSSRWRVCPYISSAIERQGGILLDLRKSLCYSLNEVGAALWQRLEFDKDGISIEKMVNILTLGGSVPRNKAESDVELFVRKLKGRGLIQLV